MKFDISVVIPCRTHDESIIKTIESLETQLDCHFEILVVFNPKLNQNLNLKRISALTVLESPKGANFARNAGLKAANSDLICFLDSDCIIQDRYFLKNYVEHMRNNEHLTGCGGLYKVAQNCSELTQVYQQIQMEWVYSGLLNSIGSTRHLLGGNLVIRRSKINFECFDETILFGGTELEYLLRLHHQNHQFQLLENQAVIHNAQLSIYSLCKKAYLQGRGLLYTQKKLKSVNTDSQNIYLPYLTKNQNHSSGYKIYKLFFRLGHGTWLKSSLKHLQIKFQYTYHRIYFYLNLVKRVK